MSLRAKRQKQAQPFLQPGEQVQATFPGQTVSPYWAALRPIGMEFAR